MGQELDCRIRYQKKIFTGRALLETDHLLFRGEERIKVLFKQLRGVTAAGGVLKLDFPQGPAELELGPAAEKWAHKILHPPSRLDKLGVKAGLTAQMTGEFEPGFADELQAAGVKVESKGKHDLVFFSAHKTGELAKIAKLAAGLKPAGALWVIYPKGIQDIREVQVIEAGRAAGLKDVKVASFSTTHTGLKFVIPVAAR